MPYLQFLFIYSSCDLKLSLPDTVSGNRLCSSWKRGCNVDMCLQSIEHQWGRFSHWKILLRQSPKVFLRRTFLARPRLWKNGQWNWYVCMVYYFWRMFVQVDTKDWIPVEWNSQHIFQRQEIHHQADRQEGSGTFFLRIFLESFQYILADSYISNFTWSELYQ